jgi:ArsR family transcriptional regulator
LPLQKPPPAQRTAFPPAINRYELPAGSKKDGGVTERVFVSHTPLRNAVDKQCENVKFVSNLREYIAMREFIKVMKAFSDPNRVKIVKMLQRRTMCVCEIQEALHISQPAVSKHMKVLEEAGLVEYQKEGLWVNYYLTGGEDSAYVATILGNMRHWLEDDPEIVELLKRLPTIRREEVCKR